ncbi:MAG: FkbM family methyltransferase [Desulfovibrionaceae bacterium]|nr:FkbM family methyltransferase [Desulfovibrionaceae bacterium]MBF0512641.1 FkbM family methyltransferase [Desulfovibrionaceae bacterium]
MKKHECDILGHPIRLGVSSEIDLYRAQTYATKEPETLQWILKYFKNDDVFYDLGANIGLFSIFCGKAFNGQCTVYAIEPESQNFASLNNNIYMNGLSDSVISCCLAMTNEVTFDILNLHPYSYDLCKISDELISGPAMHTFGGTIDYKGENFKPVHRQGVISASVDSLWSFFRCKFPTHIKIDIDGLELSVVRGMQKTLQDQRLRSVLIEVSEKDNDTDEILETIAKNGFTVDNDLTNLSKKQLEGTQFQGIYNTIFFRNS